MMNTNWRENMQIKLGDKVRDVQTGHIGTAAARAEYLGGVAQVRVDSVDKHGRLQMDWIEEGRLTVKASKRKRSK